MAQARIMPMCSDFSYSRAFSRNLGWVTEVEQQVLRGKRVAIAGLGGVGGAHLLTLTRLGIGAFHIADPDHFEIQNFNRQAGAMLSTVGAHKAEALANMAKDINPELALRVFPTGVSTDNVADFLAGADLYVDGLDFFVFGPRRVVFGACRERGIPAITAAPLGMGTAVLNFLPGSMSFDDHFGIDERLPVLENALRFMLGLAPARIQMSYLVDRSRVRLADQAGPSTAMACQICAGVAATEALKILLGRGRVMAAPRGYHFDAYQNRLVSTWRPGGWRNPLQQLALAVGRRQLARASAPGGG